MELCRLVCFCLRRGHRFEERKQLRQAFDTGLQLCP